VRYFLDESMIYSELLAFGLSAQEAKVYLSIVKLIEAPASTIANRAGVPRLSVYSMLDRLIEKELIECYQQRRARIYKVSSPHAFINQCDLEISQIQAKRERFRWFLPRLKSFIALSDEEKITHGGQFRFIEDRFYFQKIMERLSSNMPGAWYWIHDGESSQILSLFKGNALKALRCLIPFSKKKEFTSMLKNEQVRTFSDHSFAQIPHIILTASHSFFILENSPKSFMVLSLENPHVAHALKMLFEFMWNNTLEQ